MYLVHLALEPQPPGNTLPPDTGRIIAACATGEDALEHVVVHSDARPLPVIGFYLRATGLDAAEAAAERVWRRAVEAQPALSDWELRRAEVPLLMPHMLWPGVDS
ncbi:hypothetical protein ABT381_01350 [Streptomyces sp. NPDC000151]|uniref:hypothetical protein n=1 Tax=Streptomyces sp. NPDC000151 TaxID=3154244 RepID=UPI003320DF75